MKFANLNMKKEYTMPRLHIVPLQGEGTLCVSGGKSDSMPSEDKYDPKGSVDQYSSRREGGSSNGIWAAMED